MTGNGQPRYRVEPVTGAEAQMVKLLQRAAQLDRTAKVVAALRAIVRVLETQPSGWGDPLYKTHLHGGLVLRGVQRPLVAKYALFEQDRAVLLLDVRALPGDPLGLD
jgi:hypothetical protein